MRILIAAGGTGGHLYPAIALGKELKKRSCVTLFVIRSNSLASKALNLEGLDFVEASSAPVSIKKPLSILTGAFSNLKGVFEGLKAVKTFKPDCAVGFGAYVSVPSLVACALKGVPIVLHEQNVDPGWANRFCAMFSKKVAVSFPQTEKDFPGKSVLVGNPVREELLNSQPAEARKSLGLKEGLQTVLVFGGSAGAKSVNQAVVESLAGLSDLKEKIQFLHLTGRGEEKEKLEQKYAASRFHAVVLHYSDRMGDCYSSASFAVCRSGATTAAELIATKTPAVLVPYPYATGDHQKSNAYFLEGLGCAAVVLESENFGRELAEKMRSMASQDGAVKKMRENFSKFPVSLRESAGKLADAVMDAGKAGRA